MPDDFDAAQERELAEREAAILGVRLDARRDRNGGGRADCLDCGEPIPEERLRIVPGAKRCVPHQQQYDRNSGARR